MRRFRCADAADMTYLDLGGARPCLRICQDGAAAGNPGRAFRAITELKDLRVLNLGFSEINADGLRMLARRDHREVGLEGCRGSTIALWRNCRNGRA